jgi:hypothetical protein
MHDINVLLDDQLPKPPDLTQSKRRLIADGRRKMLTASLLQVLDHPAAAGYDQRTMATSHDLRSNFQRPAFDAA